MWMVYWSLSFLEYTYKNDFSFSVIVFNWHSFSLLGCQILMASWSDSPPFPLLSVTSTVPFFVSLRLWVPFILILEVANLALFIFQNSVALWPWSWGVGGGGGKNDLALISVLSLFSACHLQCWRQRVTGTLYIVRRWPHLILLPSGSIWCWWMCLSWLGAMHGFLGVVLSYILTLRFLEALSEGQLWLNSAWAFDAFYWISLLFPRVQSLPWSWWPLKKSQGNCWGWILHSPSSIENCMLWHCPTFFPA